MVITTFSCSDRTGTVLLQLSRTASQHVVSPWGFFLYLRTNNLKSNKCRRKKEICRRIFSMAKYMFTWKWEHSKRRKTRFKSLWRHAILQRIQPLIQGWFWQHRTAKQDGLKPLLGAKCNTEVSLSLALLPSPASLKWPQQNVTRGRKQVKIPKGFRNLILRNPAPASRPHSKHCHFLGLGN